MRSIWAFLLAATAVAHAEVTVLRGFTLIDGSGRPPLAKAAILVRDGHVAWTGPEQDLKTPPSAEVLHFGGKYVIPGIINGHGHLGNTFELTQAPKYFTRANVESQLKTYASYGVTAVASMSPDQDVIFQMRAEQRAGHPDMARIFTAGTGFTSRNGYPTMAPGMKGMPLEVETEQQVRKYVTVLADKRVDVVKIWVDDHLGRMPKIDIGMCRAIITESHKRGLKVAAHVFYLDDAKQLVEAGLDALAHSVRDKPVDAALIESMKRHGTWQLATLAREWATFAYGGPDPSLRDPFFTRAVSQGVLETLRSPAYQQKVRSDPDFPLYSKWLETAKANLKKLFDSGVHIGFGTDSGPPARFQGYLEHVEMQLMVEAGLSPTQVIQAATGNCAAYLGAKDLGTLEPGKWADLIVLARNPLWDIRNTRSIEAVMIGGRKVVR